MKKFNLLVLIGVIALASCSTLPPPRYPPVVIGGIVGTPNVTGDVPEASWLEVKSSSALRPSTGGPCTARAYLRPDNRVQIDPVGCVTGEARVIVDDGAHQTPQTVGTWYLVVTQRGQGVKIAEPTFRVLIEGKQIWPN